eukprot:s2600_g2.t1
MNQLRHQVTAIYFTRSADPIPRGPARPSPYLFGRYIYRASKPLQLRNWGSPVAGFLNRFGSPLVVPDRVGDLVSAHYARPSAGTWNQFAFFPCTFWPTKGRGLSQAFHVRPTIEEDDVPVKDLGLAKGEELSLLLWFVIGIGDGLDGIVDPTKSEQQLVNVNYVG